MANLISASLLWLLKKKITLVGINRVSNDMISVASSDFKNG